MKRNNKLTKGETILFIIGSIFLIIILLMCIQNYKLSQRISFLEDSEYEWFNFVIKGTNFSTYLDGRENTPEFTGTMGWWMYCRKSEGKYLIGNRTFKAKNIPKLRERNLEENE